MRHRVGSVSASDVPWGYILRPFSLHRCHGAYPFTNTHTQRTGYLHKQLYYII